MRGDAAVTAYQPRLFSTVHSSYTSVLSTLRAVLEEEQSGTGNSSSQSLCSAPSPYFSALIIDWPLERFSLWYGCQVVVVEPRCVLWEPTGHLLPIIDMRQKAPSMEMYVSH